MRKDEYQKEIITLLHYFLLVHSLIAGSIIGISFVIASGVIVR